MTVLQPLTPDDVLARHDSNESELPDVQAFIDAVHHDGDAAVRRLAAEHDGRDVDATLALTPPVLAAAYASLPGDLQTALSTAAERIKAYHEAQRKALSEVQMPLGGLQVGFDVTPVQSVACYAAAARGASPLTVMHTAIPARAAGVHHVSILSPSSDAVDPLLLAAAHLAGVDVVHPVGGPWAIAAAAFGTATIREADIIVGTGGPWTTAAKEAVRPYVGIDMLSGPANVCLVADPAADPALVAADLLAAGEHRSSACVYLALYAQSAEATWVASLEQELEQQLQLLTTADRCRRALRRGGLVVARDVQSLWPLVDSLAPELLLLHTRSAVLPSWVGHGMAVRGHEMASLLAMDLGGPSRVLPTQADGTVRGALNVFDFLIVRGFVRGGDGSADDLSRMAIRLAEAERQPAQAAALRRRLEQ